MSKKYMTIQQVTHCIEVLLSVNNLSLKHKIVDVLHSTINDDIYFAWKHETHNLFYINRIDNIRVEMTPKYLTTTVNECMDLLDELSNRGDTCLTENCDILVHIGE